MTNAHERTDGEVPEGLTTDATSSVDDEHGHVGRGGRHRHVARVLLVPRRIGDDHAAARRQQQVPIGDVDGDALLALGLEAVGEQGEVDLAERDRRAGPTGGARHRELVEGH